MIDAKFLEERITHFEQLLFTCCDTEEILKINNHIRYLKSILFQKDERRPRLIFDGRDVTSDAYNVNKAASSILIHPRITSTRESRSVKNSPLCGLFC